MNAAEADSTQFQEKQELDSTLGLMGGSILDKDDFTQEAKEAIFHKGQSNVFGMSYIKLLTLLMWLYMCWMPEIQLVPDVNLLRNT